MLRKYVEMPKIIDHPGKVTVGVIGASGVAATNRLCDLVERKVTKAGAFRDCHHPYTEYLNVEDI